MTPLALLALLRLGIATVGIALAVALGVNAYVAGLTAAAGAAFCGFAVISTRQGMYRGVHAYSGPAWRIALRATYPSTIALTALTAVALAIKPQLAAMMAGLLAGLGFAALANALAARLQQANGR